MVARGVFHLADFPLRSSHSTHAADGTKTMLDRCECMAHSCRYVAMDMRMTCTLKRFIIKTYIYMAMCILTLLFQQYTSPVDNEARRCCLAHRSGTQLVFCVIWGASLNRNRELPIDRKKWKSRKSHAELKTRASICLRLVRARTRSVSISNSLLKTAFSLLRSSIIKFSS